MYQTRSLQCSTHNLFSITDVVQAHHLAVKIAIVLGVRTRRMTLGMNDVSVALAERAPILWRKLQAERIMTSTKLWFYPLGTESSVSTHR